MPVVGVGVFVGRRKRKIGPDIAGVGPSLAPLTEGDTLSSAVTWGSYSTTFGSIVTPTTKQMQVNGGGWVSYVAGTTVAAGSTYAVREVVEDTAANSRTFSSGSQTAAYLATISLSLDPEAGEIVTTTEVDGLITWTIVGGPYEGEWSAAREDIAAAPQCLVPAAISGTATVGSTLSVDLVGLWVYDEALGAPTITRAWRRGAANISGATADTYVVQSADQGASITLRDTATQAAGARSADSNAIAIPAAPSLSVARVGSAYLGSTTGSATPDFTGADLSGLQVGDELVAVVVSNRFASALSLTGSGALTKLSGDVTPQGYGCVSVFKRAVVSGDIGAGKTFVATLDQSSSAHALVLYRVRGGTVSAVAIAVRGGVSTTLTATPSGATAAALIAVWGGVTTTTTEPTFGGATKNGASEAPTTNRLVSSSVNTSPASNTVTAATAAAFVAGLAVIAVSSTP